MTLLTLTYSKDVFAEISLFPLLYGVTSILCSLVFLGFYRCIEKIKLYRKKRNTFRNDSPKEKTSKSLLELKSYVVNKPL